MIASLKLIKIYYLDKNFYHFCGFTLVFNDSHNNKLYKNKVHGTSTSHFVFKKLLDRDFITSLYCGLDGNSHLLYLKFVTASGGIILLGDENCDNIIIRNCFTFSYQYFIHQILSHYDTDQRKFVNIEITMAKKKLLNIVK